MPARAAALAAIAILLLAQPAGERLVRFKLVAEGARVDGFTILVFRRSDRALVMVVSVAEGDAVTVSLRADDYVVGAYSKIGGVIYAGYRSVPREAQEVAVVLRPLAQLAKSRVSVRLGLSETRASAARPAYLELVVPGLGVVGRVKVSNQTAELPAVPALVACRVGGLVSWGVFLPGDRVVRIAAPTLTRAAGVRGFSALSLPKGTPMEGRARRAGLLLLIAATVISLSTAYVSYIVARRYVRRRVEA
ncbi:MAG: hypothetical protein DRJ56_01660 [Thermoprotei archaeon]|nr:MAG: hypothetical protein DRJ56_01660 [Thermoprotei archaeon]